jgi:predicted nucleic acid-binding protein
VIDSDVLIDVLRKRPEATTWFGGLTSQQTISGVAALELLFGSNDASELRRVRRFIERFRIEWSSAHDLEVASKFADLRLSSGIDILDAVSAATALRINEVMLTFNDKHFRVIPVS